MSEPTQQDLLLARAVVARGLRTRAQVEACLRELREALREGRKTSLAQVMIAQRFLGLDQIRSITKSLAAGGTGMTSTSLPATGAGAGTGGAGGATTAALAARGVIQLSSAVAPRMAVDRAAVTQDGSEPGAEPPQQPPAANARAAPSLEDQFDMGEAAPASDAPATSAVAAPAFAPAAEALTGASQYDVLASNEAEPPLPPDVRRTGMREAFQLQLESEAAFEFGPYDILEEVASGAYGVVYRARERGSNDIWALKVLHNVDTTEQELKRFILEAQAAAKLEHPGIVKIHDIGVVENVPYFTMNFLDGVPLTSILHERRIPLEKAVRLIRDVSRAVAHAHAQGVVHRDIKPDNVIVLREGGRPVLTDFGLARDRETDIHLTTKKGTAIGTPFYLSPEAVTGRIDEVDARTDVFALGVILYQVLTGRLPHLGKSLYELQQHIVDKPPLFPREIDPALPEALERVCLKALAKRPADRYQTASAFADDLDRHLAGQPVEAPEPVLKLGKPGDGAAAAGRVPASRLRRDLLIVGIVLLVEAVLAAAWFLAIRPP